MKGTPDGSACHGAARSRKTASFLFLLSSSSSANLLIFIVVKFPEMAKMMICMFFVHHLGVLTVKKIQMTIREISDVTGIHRQTISKRLAGVPPLPGSSSKRKFYDLKSALSAIYTVGFKAI